MDTLKILFKFPCRGRKDMFFESLESIHNFIADKENYHVSLTLDTDDEILNKPDVVERINEFPNTSIEWGLSESKIHAINRSMPTNYDWDIIICWSQDMFAKMYGFDQIIREGIFNVWGNTGLDGLAHFPEPDSKQYLNVLYIATRKYYERFGYIYHPSYKSLWCDNESMEVAKKLGKYNYFDTMGLYEHRNPAYHQYNIPRDELFNLQQSFWAVDEANFKERQSNNFFISKLKENECIVSGS